MQQYSSPALQHNMLTSPFFSFLCWSCGHRQDNFCSDPPTSRNSVQSWRLFQLARSAYSAGFRWPDRDNCATGQVLCTGRARSPHRLPAFLVHRLTVCVAVRSTCRRTRGEGADELAMLTCEDGGLRQQRGHPDADKVRSNQGETRRTSMRQVGVSASRTVVLLGKSLVLTTSHN